MHQRPISFFMILFCWLTLGGSIVAQGNVRAVVVNEFANIRTVPAIGATVIDTVSAGHEFNIVTARSGDSLWLRVIYMGSEGWVHTAPLVILDGNIDALPVADPRSIPYGGFDAPRAGTSDQIGPVAARPSTGLRLRAGPSTAYPTLANIARNEGITLTGVFAYGGWYQANYEGILGWVSAQYVEILSGNITTLPVDGIIAAAPPTSGDINDDFLGILRLMLDRLNISQEALNEIRARWTDAALLGRAQCSGVYPPRPTDIQIALPILAAFRPTLEPLQADFNAAMANLRLAINLYIDVCNLPGTGNPVGQATVQGALEAINATEVLFNSLRVRLNELIPSRDVGVGECLLEFNGNVEILPLITVGTIYLEEFNRRKTEVGFCFDVFENQVLNLQIMPLPESNLALFTSVSPFDTPTDFLVVSRQSTGFSLSVGPIDVPRTGRYLLIIADLFDAGEGTPSGQFAFRLSDISLDQPLVYLAWDDVSESVILSLDPSSNRNPAIDEETGLGGGGGGGDVPTPIAPTPTPSTGVCQSTAFTCAELFTCSEARACYAAGNFSLDGDGNGVPCDEPEAGNLCP